jgi:hypothetical protein
MCEHALREIIQFFPELNIEETKKQPSLHIRKQIQMTFSKLLIVYFILILIFLWEFGPFS